MRFNVSIYNIKFGAPTLESVEYYCSTCGDCLSNQEGFSTKEESLDCLECGTHYEISSLIGKKEHKLPTKLITDLYCERENLVTKIREYIETECPNEVESFEYDVLSTGEEDGVNEDEEEEVTLSEEDDNED